MHDANADLTMTDASPIGRFVVVGVSHRSAPLAVLEHLVLSQNGRGDVLEHLAVSPGVAEAMVVSTCNRVEMYAVVDAMPDALHRLCAALAHYTDTTAHELATSGYVYCLRGHDAVEQLFRVTAGLDSMVIGDQQIIGQVRTAYAASIAHQTAGPTLHRVAQRALYTGKRIRSLTDIGRAGASVISSGLSKAALALPAAQLVGCRAVVIGAGAMAALAVNQLQRAGAAHISVANRTASRASAVVRKASTTAKTATAWADLPAAVSDADVLISCTGAMGWVWTLAQTQAALAMRMATRPPLVICDFAFPRDVEPAVANMPGVVLIDMDVLQRDRVVDGTAVNKAAEAMITAEVDRVVSNHRAAGPRRRSQLTALADRQTAA